MQEQAPLPPEAHGPDTGEHPAVERRDDGGSRYRISVLEQRYQRFQRKSLIGQAVVSVFVISALVASCLNYNGIQDSRRDAIRNACEEQNERNRETIAQLDALLLTLRNNPEVPQAEKDRSQRNRQGTILLIEALAPSQNCDDLVKRRVDTKTRNGAQ